MGIPEADLTNMAVIGAQVTSKDTYATVKLALETKETGYSTKQYKIFLQGSYGNDTNIFRESDVDVVIRLDSIFTYDLEQLPPLQREAFNAVHPAAAYSYAQFRNDVLAALKLRFGDDVVPGNKAVMINPLNNRRKADVLIAFMHRRYARYENSVNSDYTTGISFLKSDGRRVVNFPQQHKENLTSKNQRTNEWFKHIVRIFKNARQKLIENGTIKPGTAPSYYIEGLLYNVPDENFGVSYSNSMVSAINWLVQADRTSFVCANEQYALLDSNSDVTWNSESCNAFLNGIVELWNEW